MKRRNNAFLIMIFTVLFGSISGCKAQNGNKFSSLSVESFEKAISDTSVLRLDVRTSDEFMEGHLPNAINIDYLKPDFDSLVSVRLTKEKTIAVYCRSGNRSKKAASVLVNKDYKVVELSTGFNGWVTAGKEITKGNSK